MQGRCQTYSGGETAGQRLHFLLRLASGGSGGAYMPNERNAGGAYSGGAYMPSFGMCAVIPTLRTTPFSRVSFADITKRLSAPPRKGLCLAESSNAPPGKGLRLAESGLLRLGHFLRRNG